ncbi:MAG: cell division protein SepF [Eubacteriales bacterium]|nr:cell division protein SepF [Eubacteriales bacterium]
MAGKFVGKLMNIIGLEEEYEDEEEFYDDAEEEEEERPRAARRRDAVRASAADRDVESRRETASPRLSGRRETAAEERRSALRPVEKQREEQPIQFSERRNRKNKEAAGGNTDVKLVVYRPHSYNDSQNIIDNLVANKPIIVNLEDLDPEMAQRVLDFMSGAAYAENGSVMKVSRGIFLVAPNNVDVFGNLEDEMRTNDFFNLNSEEQNG